ncbi:MAG: hypothetical protein Fur0040_05040 [Sideroxydans sp.]
MDHPLADLKSAQSLLDDLPRADSLRTLQEIADLLEALREQVQNFKPEHTWAVLRLLDQTAQPHLRKLLHDYFPLQPLSAFQENRLWTLLHHYYTLSAAAHDDVLAQCRDNSKVAAALRTDLTLLCTRGLAANLGLLKLIGARYGMVEPSLWQRVAAFYSFAESRGLADDMVAMYAGVQTSVTQEFAVLVAWYGATAGTLTPLHGHISERLFNYLGRGLSVVPNFSGHGLFAFDIAQPTPPMRATAEATIHSGLRFIEATTLHTQLDGLIKTLDKGIIPEALNLYGARYEAELVRQVAGQLAQALTLPPPTRRNVRRRISVNLKVASGLQRMLEQTDVGLNFGADECEQWEVEDISATGFRSVVPLAHANGIHIGTLIGSKPENLSHWGAGVVRRLRRDEGGNLHIGVEILSPRVVGVAITDRTRSGPEAGALALYLNRPNDASGEAWLLQRAESFAPSRSLVMQMDDKEYLLLPLSLVERGEDYDLARYRMMEQDRSAE